MKSKYFLILLLLVPIYSVAQQDVVAEDREQAIDLQTLIEQCEGCHGPNGESTREDIPGLAGQDEAKIEESIAQFYYYERHCPTKVPEYDGHEGNPMDMCAVANSLSTAEIQALAHYFASQ
jgi:cytochrome c553